MSTAPDTVVRLLRQDLRRHADPTEARRLNRRHRGDVAFLGVRVRDVVRLTHARTAELPLTHDEWHDTVSGLWTGDATRESRYAAVALTRHRRYRGYASTPLATALYRELIPDRPTVDVVDALAVLSLVLPLEAHPETEAPVIRSWAVVGSPWLRRAAILCQARRRTRVDSDLLKACVGANLRERRTVVRDAIPHAIAAYVRGLPQAEPCLRATLDAWSSQISPVLADAIEQTLAADDGHR